MNYSWTKYKQILQNFLSSSKQKATSNEQQVTSVGEKLTNNKQKLTSYKQRAKSFTSNLFHTLKKIALSRQMNIIVMKDL